MQAIKVSGQVMNKKIWNRWGNKWGSRCKWQHVNGWQIQASDQRLEKLVANTTSKRDYPRVTTQEKLPKTIQKNPIYEK